MFFIHHSLICENSFFHVFLGPPVAPTNIRFTDRLEGFIIHWDFLRKDLATYQFQLTDARNKVQEYTLAEKPREGENHLQFEIRDLARGASYKLQMRAVDKDGQIGAWSKSVDIVTVKEIGPYNDHPLPLKIAVTEGVNYVIKCQIRGKPHPLIKWTVNGTVIRESDSKYKMDRGKGELVLVNPLRNTVNGMYQCGAGNKLGSISNNPTAVNVECKSIVLFEKKARLL